MDTSCVTLPRRSFVGVMVSVLAACAGWTRREAAPATVVQASEAVDFQWTETGMEFVDGGWRSYSRTRKWDREHIAALKALDAKAVKLRAEMARDLNSRVFGGRA